jgi:integrase
MKITVKQLEALCPSDAGKTIRETGGLVGKVRVSKAGVVSVGFSFEFRFKSRKREYSCGVWPRASLADIRGTRDEARALLGRGTDPVEAKNAAKLESQVAIQMRINNAQAVFSRKTFQERFGEWEASALKKRKDKGAEIRRGFDKDVLPAVGKIAMEDIKRSHLMSVLDAIVARGANQQANRTLCDLKQLVKWCLLREYIATDPLLGIAKKNVGGPDNERDRTLSEDELHALPAALENAELLQTTKHALLLILATNARVGEVIKTRKEHVVLEAGLWRIPTANAKNEDAHFVFLSAFALRHMKALMALSDSDEWLLPDRKGDGHVGLKTITIQVADRQLKFYERKAHANRSKHENALVLGNEKWTPHDLRRTASTLMQELGILPVVIEKCLNHRERNRVKRIYQRYPYTIEKREAWRLLGDRLERFANPDPTNAAVLKSDAARMLTVAKVAADATR